MAEVANALVNAVNSDIHCPWLAQNQEFAVASGFGTLSQLAARGIQAAEDEVPERAIFGIAEVSVTVETGSGPVSVQLSGRSQVYARSWQPIVPDVLNQGLVFSNSIDGG